MGSFQSYIREWDLFGQPIQLNYKKSDAYKTVCGALLSFVYYFMISIFLYESLNQMIDNSNWSLVTQQELSSKDDLNSPNNLGDYTPFKLGIELRPVEENFNMNRSLYESLAHTVNKNLKIVENFYESDGVNTKKINSSKPQNNFARYNTEFSNVYKGYLQEQNEHLSNNS